MDEQSIESLLERLQCSRYIEDGVTGKRTDGIRRTLRTLVAQYEDDQIIGAISTGTAPGFIDALLQHLRREHSSKSHLSAHLTKLMLRAAHVTACLPPSLFISGVSITDLNLVYGGGFADIYQGEYEGHLVAVRCLRFFTNQSRKRRAEVERVLYREALLWRSLNHPRLLELYGIDQQVRPPLLCMISPWMDQGNMNQYIDHYQPPRSTIFRLLCEVAEGLAYIHGRHLVHGDLRGANILINDDHEAVLADFGLARVTDVTRSTSRNAGAVRWMAPELHDPTLAEGADRRSADVYSFAMLWVEVWTEYPPFESISKEGQVILTVMAGNRPDRPRHESHGYLTDCLWELVQACWHQEPQWRPAIRDVWAWLHGYINNTYLLYHPLFSSAGISQRSQSLLKTTALPPVPSRSLSRSGHYRVGKNSRRLLGPCYLDARRDGLKAPVFSSQKVRLALSRGMRHAKPIGMASPVELEIWKGIRHPNVACPIGFAYWNSEVYMVTPCTVNGTAVDYLARYPETNKLELIIGVASGLDYLHRQSFIHGDLRAENVLISDAGTPMLADVRFGCQDYEQDTLPANTRWLAPELLRVPSGPMNKVRFKSTLTDMWGFGMLCLELMTGRVPFWTIQRERDVARHILNGSLPDIPEITSAGVTDNQLWRHVTSCWKSEPLERIPIAELRLSLSHLQTVSHTEEGFFYMDALDEVNPPHPENPHDEEFDESRPWSTTRLTKPLFSIKRRATL